MANTPQIKLYNESIEKWELPDAGKLYDSLYGSYTAYDVFMLQRDVAGLLANKADKDDIPTRTSDLENNSGFITLKDVPEVDLSDIQNQLDGKASQYHAHYATDILTESAGKTQETVNKEVKEGMDILDVKLSEKSDKSHGHSTTDISGLDSDIKSMWTAINGKAFTDHTHMPGDVYINHSGDKLSDISAKHIDFDGWDTVDDKLKSLQSQITGLDIPEHVDLTEINNEIHNLQLKKADKTEIPTKLSQLEQDIEVGKVKSVNDKVGDVKLDANDIEYSAGWSVYNELGRKASQYIVGELEKNKANKEDIPTKLSQLEQDIETGAVKDVNGKTGNVVLTGSDLMVSMSWSEAISDVMWDVYSNRVESVNGKSGKLDIDAYNIPINSNNSSWTVNDELNRKASSYLVEQLEQDKANKKDIPTKLSQLEQDIELGSEFVIPRTTTTPKEDEITVHETPKQAFQLNIRSISEGVKQEGNTFDFTSDDGYSSLDFEVLEGEGTLVGTFSNAAGYYSYSHRKVNGDRDDSGWVKGDKTVSVDVVKGDEFRISTGGAMVFKLGDIPTTVEKMLYFNNEAINKDTDLTQVYSDIGEVKSQLGYKADRNHEHEEYMKADDSLISTGYSLPTPSSTYRGEIFTLFGDVDIPYICLKVKDKYIWQKLIVSGAVWDDFK